MAMRLEQKQKLKLNYYPRMELSLKMLGMNDVELKDFLQDFAEKNPLADIDDGPAFSVTPYSSFDMPDAQDTRRSVFDIAAEQIGITKLSKVEYGCAIFVAQQLSGDGFLPEQLIRGRYSEADIKKAAEIIKSLDPPGIGAQSVGECMKLQLSRSGELTQLRESIIDNYFFDINRKNFFKTAQLLDISAEELKDEYLLLKSLNPKPCAAKAFGGVNEYVRPDIIVTHEGDSIKISYDIFCPAVSVGSEYKSLASESEDSEAQKYLAQQLKSVNALAGCLKRRSDTIERIGAAIVAFQKDFFLGGFEKLRPMNLKDIAGLIGMHESTVSRTIKNKFIQCGSGVFEIKKLFTGAVDSKEGLSAAAVKNKIKDMIADEKKDAPLSDQKIADVLLGRGIRISRRTVHKYREQMNIPSSHMRY